VSSKILTTFNYCLKKLEKWKISDAVVLQFFDQLYKYMDMTLWNELMARPGTVCERLTRQQREGKDELRRGSNKATKRQSDKTTKRPNDQVTKRQKRKQKHNLRARSSTNS
jgi:hypothetical protein